MNNLFNNVNNNLLSKNVDLGINILRVGLGLTILWFGISQLVNPNEWIGYLPEWAFSISVISTITFVILNGIFETLTAAMLITNQYSKLSAILLSIHMIVIVFHLGYNDIAIRDIGIFFGCLALVFLLENKCYFKK